MTTTNQAFIRVYRRDAAQAGQPILASAGDEQPSAAALHSSVEYVVAGAGSASRSAGRRHSGTSHFGTSIDVLPPATQSSTASGFLFKAGLGEGGRTTGHQPAHRRVDSAAKSKRPLSAFLGRQQPPEPAVAKAISSRPRAGTTVASLRWPQVCRALMQQCAADLDCLAELLLAQVARGRSLFGVMSLFPNGGCTTAAFMLAARLARADRRVALVEGSFYSPRLAAWLDATPTAGWQEVLENAAPVADSLVHAVDENLDLLPLSGMSPFDPLPLAAGRQATSTALYLRERYELALVDLGAFFDPRSQPVALELARNMGIDAVLAVAGPQPVDERDIATLAEHLHNSGCELLGIIENRISDFTSGS
jgi:Mrp family chromosome partitioning ATPase